MRKRASNIPAIAAVVTHMLMATAWAGDSTALPRSERAADPKWVPVTVQFPASTSLFPDGQGATIANSQCLICHSAGMVLRQPERTAAQWKDTINKMRTAYGAPIPVEQVAPLAAYLSRVVAHDAQDQRTSAEQPHQSPSGEHPSDGAEIFAAQCVACHQATGEGIPGVFPPLAGSNWVNGPGAPLARILLHGVQGTLTVNGKAYHGAMPNFGQQLSDAQVAAVLTYIRGQWGNRAESVDAALVAAQRAATRGQSTPLNGDADLAK
jgi:mono/diheme cytochrome c family protein